jgi:hypothetical protein
MKPPERFGQTTVVERIVLSSAGMEISRTTVRGTQELRLGRTSRIVDATQSAERLQMRTISGPLIDHENYAACF